MVWNDVLFLAVETQRVGTCIGTCIGAILFFKNCCFHGVEAKRCRSAIGASPWKGSIIPTNTNTETHTMFFTLDTPQVLGQIYTPFPRGRSDSAPTPFRADAMETAVFKK